VGRGALNVPVEGSPWYYYPYHIGNKFRKKGDVRGIIDQLENKGYIVHLSDDFRAAVNVLDPSQILINPNSFNWSIWEEYIHSLQLVGVGRTGQLVLRHELRHLKGVVAQSAMEIQAKQFLLKHSDKLNISPLDRWFVKQQLKRIQKTGAGVRRDGTNAKY